MKLTPVQQRLVLDNQKLVGYFLAKYAPNYYTHIPFEDREAILQLGLCTAASRYKPESGFKFSTFALNIMRNILHREAKSYNRGLSVSFNTWNHYLSSARKLKGKRMDDCSIDELAELLGCKKGIAKGVKLFSEQSLVNSSTYTVLEDILNTDTTLEIDEDNYRKFIKACVDKYFSHNDRIYIYKYYGIDQPDEKHWTFDEIGRDAGISKQRVAQRIYRAKVRMRNIIGEKLDAYI